jgi:3-deoxy-D-manno-octulosonate 8-phosphate phosphatase (KDO 8-P phosphatase)
MSQKIIDIQLIVFDVDGVLTDGSIIYGNTGNEFKRFNIRDGFGIRAARFSGIQVGVLTARSSEVVHRRMEELKIDHYFHGCKNKAEGIQAISERARVSLEQTAFMGDDILDLPAMKKVGYPMAVADAAIEVLETARFVSEAKGGRGAAREAVEHILRAQGKWDEVLEKFGG